MMKSKLQNIKLFTYLLAFTGFLSCEKETNNQSNENTEVFSSVSSIYNISTREAEQVSVAAYYSSLNSILDGTTLEKKLAPEVEETIMIPDENGNPALYVVKFKEKGYYVLSATKKERPILGYSEEDQFNINNLPLGMAEWFYERMHKIQIINDADEYETPDIVSSEWAALGLDNSKNANALTSAGTAVNAISVTSTVVGEYGPLLTTTWGQGSPYNDDLSLVRCSDGSYETPPSGCVATAIAQVARYHAFGNKYNWSIMPSSTSSGRSVAGDAEVAELMDDIGDAVDMNYGCGSSGATTKDAIDVFEDLFDYSSGGTYAELSTEEAEQAVGLNILFYGQPVIMKGSHTYYTSTSGWWLWETTTHHYEDGHAWVCDGYRYVKNEISGLPFFGDNVITTYSKFYHMNWGWNGSGMGASNNNGWFLLDDIEVAGVNINTSKGLVNPNFQHKKGYITGIRP